MSLNGRCFPASTAYPQRLSQKSIVVSRVDVAAYQSNAGRVYVAKNRIYGTVGKETAPGLSLDDIITFENVDLRDIWVAIVTAGDGVLWMTD